MKDEKVEIKRKGKKRKHGVKNWIKESAINVLKKENGEWNVESYKGEEEKEEKYGRTFWKE